MSLVRPLFSFCLFLVLMYGALQVLKLSSYWESQVHPVKKVIAYWKDGQTIEGDLSRTFLGHLVITDGVGDQHILKEEPYVISYGVKDQDSSTRSFWHSWRSWLPFLIYMIFVLRYFVFTSFDGAYFSGKGRKKN